MQFRTRLSFLFAVVLVAIAVALLPATAFAAKPKPRATPTPRPATSTSPRGSTSFTQPTVSSQLSLNPYSGPPGAVVTAIGKSFYYHQKLTLYWDTKDRVVGTVTADANGSFTTQIRPPTDFVGNHSICLREAPWVQCQIFGLLPKVPAALTLAPAEGQPGTAIQVTGKNFDANTQLQVAWSTNSKPLGTLLADAQGNISGRIDIPEVSAGDYQLCLKPINNPTGQPACAKVTVDPVPVAAVNETSNGLAKIFSYLIIVLGLCGGLLFFLASRRHPADLPNATVEHRIGPVVMPSTYKEFWDSMQPEPPVSPERVRKGAGRPQPG